MLKNDKRLQTGHVGKKPTAARIHLQGMFLHLQKSEPSDLSFPVKSPPSIVIKKIFDSIRRTGKEDMDVAISRFPNVFEYPLPLSFEEQTQLISQKIESLS